MKRTLRIIRLIFESWGYLSAAGLTILLVLAFWGWVRPAKIDQAGFRNVRHLLNWAHVGEERFSKVTNSFESPLTGLEGDYSKAYAIKVKEVPLTLFQPNEAIDESTWHVFPVANPIFMDALTLALSIRDTYNQRWIPSLPELVSPRFRVYFHNFSYYENHSEYVGLFIIDTKELILYYLEHKV